MRRAKEIRVKIYYMKILLIDDERAILDVLSQALTQGGFSVVTAPHGTKGLELAKSEKPDMILLDQILPDMNGNDVLKKLKADEVTKAIPVAMLSNFSQDGMVSDALKSGAVEYILKYQIGPQDLVQKVKTLLAKPKETGEKWMDENVI